MMSPLSTNTMALSHVNSDHSSSSKNKNEFSVSRLNRHFVSLINAMSERNSYGMALFRQGKHPEAMKQFQMIIETSLETMDLWMIARADEQPSGKESLMQTLSSSEAEHHSFNKKYDLLQTTGLAEAITIRRTSLASSSHRSSFDTLRCWVMCAAVAAIHNSALVLVEVKQFRDAAEQISNALSLWDESLLSFTPAQQDLLIYSNHEFMKMIMSLHFIKAKIHTNMMTLTFNNVLENQYDIRHQQDEVDVQEWHIVQAVDNLTCAYELGQQILAFMVSMQQKPGKHCQNEGVLLFIQMFQSRVLSNLGFCLLRLRGEGRDDQSDLILDMYQSAVDCYNRIDVPISSEMLADSKTKNETEEGTVNGSPMSVSVPTVNGTVTRMHTLTNAPAA